MPVLVLFTPYSICDIAACLVGKSVDEGLARRQAEQDKRYKAEKDSS